jgi:hypothetical protein
MDCEKENITSKIEKGLGWIHQRLDHGIYLKYFLEGETHQFSENLNHKKEKITKYTSKQKQKIQKKHRQTSRPIDFA